MYIEQLWVGKKSGFGGVFVEKIQYILNSASYLLTYLLTYLLIYLLTYLLTL